MESISFKRFGGLCAILTGVVGLLYAVAFIVIARSNPQLGGLLSALFLAVGGLLSTAVFTALYLHLETADRGFALWALLLGMIAAIGSAIHGAYDLANAIHVPDSLPANLANLPNQVDPRGLLTFRLAGVAVLVVAWLGARSGRLPRNLGYLGYVLGVLLVVIYLARLIILDATNPLIVVTVLITGFIINPLWNVWLGLTLRRA
jgi:hypothetical protein